MSRAHRLGLLALAAAVAVAAFIVLRPDDDRQPSRPASEGEQTPGSTAGRERQAASPRRRAEPVPVLRAGRVQTVVARKGERVRFAARSTTNDEVHVHGYDVVRAAPAGSTVRVSFVARLEGVFEVELERSKTPIGRVRVEP